MKNKNKIVKNKKRLCNVLFICVYSRMCLTDDTRRLLYCVCLHCHSAPACFELFFFSSKRMYKNGTQHRESTKNRIYLCVSVTALLTCHIIFIYILCCTAYLKHGYARRNTVLSSSTAWHMFVCAACSMYCWERPLLGQDWIGTLHAMENGGTRDTKITHTDMHLMRCALWSFFVSSIKW